MKRLAPLLVLLSTAARAADLSAPPAPVAATPIWQGFYLGAVGGYAADASSGGLLKPSGPTAGGTIGLQGQWGALVAGIEADGGWANVKASTTVAGITGASNVKAAATVRGRVGVAFDQVLVYGTAGFAWAQDTITLSVPGLALSDSQTHTGWVAGGGAEYMIAPRWSVKAEYLYRDFGSQTYFTAQLPPGLPSGTLKVHSGQIGVNFHF